MTKPILHSPLTVAFDAYRRRNRSILLTAGVQHRGDSFVPAVLSTLPRYDQLYPRDERWHGEEFAAIVIFDETAHFKVDCYNVHCVRASEYVTCTVLTAILTNQ